MGSASAAAEGRFDLQSQRPALRLVITNDAPISLEAQMVEVVRSGWSLLPDRSPEKRMALAGCFARVARGGRLRPAERRFLRRELLFIEAEMTRLIVQRSM